jgi:hypothetical protein
LPVGFQIYAVGDELRSKSANCCERANPHSRGAVDQMPAANSGMGLNDKLRTSIHLVREMPARARGEAGDPVELADNCRRPEVEQVDVLAKRKVPDAGILLHHQALWKNPAEADVTAGMKRIAELFFQQGAPQFPRKEDGKKHQDSLYHIGANER